MTEPAPTFASPERLLQVSPEGSTGVPGEVDDDRLSEWWRSLSDAQFRAVWVAHVVELATEGMGVGSLAKVLVAVRNRYERAEQAAGPDPSAGRSVAPPARKMRGRGNRRAAVETGTLLALLTAAARGGPVRVREALGELGNDAYAVSRAVRAARQSATLRVLKRGGNGLWVEEATDAR